VLLNYILRKAVVQLHNNVKEKGEAIPVTGRGGPYGCETSRLPHFLYNEFRHGGEVK
jgi:hypothetical protein